VATRRPLVVLTSNATRELSEALRRRCLYLPVEYPSLDREREIVRARVPDLDESLAGQVARVVAWLRRLELKKPPSVSESIDWARTLVVLGAHTLDEATIQQTLQVVLKHQRDLEQARAQLGGLAR
jgi:MoxR-like ATPase